MEFFAAANVSSSFPPPDVPEIAFAGNAFKLLFPPGTLGTLGKCMFSYFREDIPLLKGGAIWCLNFDQEGQMLANRRC